MKSIKTKLVVLGMLAGMQATAGASLLNPSEYQEGNLTWLTLAETVGLSVTNFNNGVGGWNSAYRLATDSEIAALIDSFGIEASSSATTKQNTVIGHFIGEVGGQYAGHNGTWFDNGSLGARGQTGSAYVDIGIVTDNVFPTPDCPANYDCGFADISYTHYVTSPISTIGLFLVEKDALSSSVPEPSTVTLFGAVGLVAWLRRRRKEN